MLSQYSSHATPQRSARLRTHPVLAARGQSGKLITAAPCFSSDRVSQYSRMGSPLGVAHGIEDIVPSVTPEPAQSYLPHGQWPLQQTQKRNQTHLSQFTYYEEGQRVSILSPLAFSSPFSKSRSLCITPPATLTIVDETTSAKTHTTASVAQNSFRQKGISRPSQNVRAEFHQASRKNVSAIKPNMSTAPLPPHAHPPKVQLSVQRHEVKDQQQCPQFLRLGVPLRVVCGIEDIAPCVKPLMSEPIRSHFSTTVIQSQLQSQSFQSLSEVRTRPMSAQFCSASTAQICCRPSTGISQTCSLKLHGLPPEIRSPATLTIEDETAVGDSKSSLSTVKESFVQQKMTRSPQDTILKAIQATQGPLTTVKSEASTPPVLHPPKEREEGKTPSQPVFSSSAAPQLSSKRPPPPTTFLLSQPPFSLRRHPILSGRKAPPSIETRANTQSYKSTTAASSFGSCQFPQYLRIETPACGSEDNTQYATPPASVSLRMQEQIKTQIPTVTAELREKRQPAPMLLSPAAQFLSTMPPPPWSAPLSSSPVTVTPSPLVPVAMDQTCPLSVRQQGT